MTGTINCWPFDAVSSAPSYTGEMLRQTTGGVFGGKTSTRPLGAQSGVWPGTPLAVVSISGTTVTVGSHGGVLDLEASATAGPYVYAVAVAPTLTINAANATNPRIDLISLQLSDPAEGDGTSVPSVVAVYTAGTAASIPAPPAAPARSLTLAQVNVPHSGGGSATITPVATYAFAAGGIAPCSSSTFYPASPYQGQMIFDLTLNYYLFWTGSAWQEVNQTTGFGFTTPSLGSSWVDAVSPTGPPKYVLINGIVYVTGGMKSGSGGTVFTFPAGMRPLAQINRLVASASGAAIVTVSSAGLLVVATYISPGSNAGVNLEFCYVAEQ